eukprot:3002413-Prymnesium_polylepis.1
MPSHLAVRRELELPRVLRRRQQRVDHGEGEVEAARLVVRRQPALLRKHPPVVQEDVRLPARRTKTRGCVRNSVTAESGVGASVASARLGVVQVRRRRECRLSRGQRREGGECRRREARRRCRGAHLARRAHRVEHVEQRLRVRQQERVQPQVRRDALDLERALDLRPRLVPLVAPRRPLARPLALARVRLDRHDDRERLDVRRLAVD